jgi:hypothetical protein
MIADHRIRRRVGRCGSWLPLADFCGVGGLQPRVARPKSTDSCCFQGVVGVTRHNNNNGALLSQTWVIAKATVLRVRTHSAS